MTERDGGFEIYTMNADGSAQTNLTATSSHDEDEPSWSPDGSKIAYNTCVAAERHLHDRRQRHSPEAVDEGAGNDAEPSWSPDGTKIAFRSVREGESRSTR